MKRKFIECCFLCFIISFSYSENDIYFDADQNTKILITNTDQLIKDRRYESAFNNLGKIDTNEYIIAKKVEICLNYFVQSIMHQMFAFKDLQNNEDIYKLRGEKGTYNIIVYDPVKVIQTFDKNESSAILNKALGDYYYEINLRYKGRWIISDEEVQKNAIKYYESALIKNCYTSNSLANYAELCLFKGDYNKSIDLYNKALQIDPSLINPHYNLALAYKYVGNYILSIKEAEIACKLYDSNIEYKIDAYLICSDSSLLNNQNQKAIEYLQEAIKYSKNDYRIYSKLNVIYLSIKEIDNANKNADILFSLYPTNPGATQIVMDNYIKANEKNALVNFFERNIQLYQGKFEVLGNLYFHLAYYYSNNNQELTVINAEKAKLNFQQANKYTDEINNALDRFLVK